MCRVLTRTGVLTLMGDTGARAVAGAALTPLQHAWQCGQMARRAGAPVALQLASWLHDLGHLITQAGMAPEVRAGAAGHDQLGARALAPMFGEAVARPIGLHVQAKRYLVATRPAYRDMLSRASLLSLDRQGGPMSASDQAAFLACEDASDALRLRAWDDAARIPSPQAFDLQHALHELDVLMEQVLGG
jgi:predicted HD phosphohydrolase